ncbi:MAG TPA: DUF1573 domain-containing protein [Puia sp.]|nr:DUF1573 domain-containing protein [Puia sp.]
MRIVALCAIATIIFIACNSTDKKTGISPVIPALASTGHVDSSQLTSIEWLDSSDRDFGKIAEGQKLEVSFRFRNSGDKPLIIQRVQPSCGCTIAEQPTEPVLPGAEGVIKAAFNSENHVGINHKSLYVFANTKRSQSHELRFDVEVEKKKW